MNDLTITELVHQAEHSAAMERENMAAAYARLLRRNSDPEPGDAEAMLDAMRVLGINAETVERDAADVERMLEMEQQLDTNYKLEKKEAPERPKKLWAMDAEIKELTGRLKQLTEDRENLWSTSQIRARHNAHLIREMQMLRQRNRRAFNEPPPVDPWDLRKTTITESAPSSPSPEISPPPQRKRNFTSIGALPSE